MELLEKIAKDSEELIKISDDHMKEKLQARLSMQRHRELAETADFTSQERISRMFMNRTKEEWMTTLSLILEGKEKELESKNNLLSENWKHQDEVARQKRLNRTEQAKAEMETETFTKLQTEIMQRMQRLQLARLYYIYIYIYIYV